jgi:hypothetical protein
MSDDIKIHDPASRAMEKDYEESDLQHVLRRQEWKNWDEVISWLREEGDNDRRLTPGEVKHMVQDLSRVKEQGEPFTKDAHQIFEKARAGRGGSGGGG